jgi:hypothetical protein
MSKTTIERILNNRPDPLDVLKSTSYVVEHARRVQIVLDAIKRAADTLTDRGVEPPAWDYEHHYFDGTPRSVNYLFLLDTLNFCFWGKPRWRVAYKNQQLDGYWALAASLKRALETRPELAEADFLARITPQELAEVLHGRGTIPLFVERWRNVRELGTALRNLWDGQGARLVECAERDAPRLAQMVAENFASFSDITVYDNREVRFLKRAQILVTDLWGAFHGQAWGQFDDIGALTAFADYKLPQLLRAWGILSYAPSLARKVDGQIELAAGSAEEIEIRAATLWGVEFLREELAARGRTLESVQVDWILWNASQGKFKNMKPYHRVRTIYY